MDLNEIQRASQDQFARQSHRYGKGHILAQTEDIAAALPHLVLPAKAQVLDVATGGGHTGIFFAERGHDVTVADIAEPILERASALATEQGLRLKTQQHPAESFPNPDSTFDLVTCRVAPHHFSSVKSFVSETARVLKPGGFFLLIDGTIEDGQPEAEQWLHQVEKLRDPSHHRFFTPKAWKSLCSESGLEVVDCEIYPKQQPDLNWYFEAANTPAENRLEVRRLIRTPSPDIRSFFRIKETETTMWCWQMLRLVAQKS